VDPFDRLLASVIRAPVSVWPTILLSIRRTFWFFVGHLDMLMQKIRTNASRILVGALIFTLAACKSSNDDEIVPPVRAAEAARVDIDAELIEVFTEVSVSNDGSSITLNDPVLEHSLPILVVNADAEDEPQVSGEPETIGVAGFVSTVECSSGEFGLVAASGTATFRLGSGCSLYQRVDALHEVSSAWSLTFDLQADIAIGMPAVKAEILAVDDSGEIDLIADRTVSLDSASADWHTVQLISNFEQDEAHSGKHIAIRLSNPFNASAVYIDNLKLLKHKPSPRGNQGFKDTFDWSCDQIWTGENFWANRAHDWQIKNGRLETRIADSNKPLRTHHRITSVINSTPESFSLSVGTGPVASAGRNSFSGFLLGAGAGMDYRSSSLIHNRHGLHGGVLVGINHRGQVFVRDNGLANNVLAIGEPSSAASSEGATLQVDAEAGTNGQYRLSIFATNASNQPLSSTFVILQPEKLLGNMALVSTPGVQSTHHWFDNWLGVGGKLDEYPNRRFGPVLFSSYTTSRNVLTVNAQYPITCIDAFHDPVLQVMQDEQWQDVASTTIDSESYTAKFVVPNWTAKSNTRYRIATRTKSYESAKNYFFEGIIRADPKDRSELTIGVFNCRPGVLHRPSEGWIQNKNLEPFTWTRDRIVFPHEELFSNASHQSLDLIAFLGDQLYEFDPNGLIDKSEENLIHDYLWKWFQFGWSARETMRNIPTFILPDDHDVYQGNVWGQGGRPAEIPEEGGYVHPPEFVNVVQRTQAGSLPGPFDDTPVSQDISVYYTDIVYGGVGMAILEDRKFKTGAHSSQKPLQLWGTRQLDFLNSWTQDWAGQDMKLAFSQSPLAQSATHSGADFNLNLGDRDANGWPKEGRDRAVEVLRKAFAPHVTGDQHLGMSLKHGLDVADDAIHSFAGPSMLNIFPRVWDPNNSSGGRGNEEDDYRGVHLDAHGNLISVLAAANPNSYYSTYNQSKVVSKNDLGIGYGVVRVRKAEREYVFEAWPANVNPIEPGASPYTHWPIVVAQRSNDGRIPIGFLTARTASVANPVVTVFKESDNSLLYSRRYLNAQIELPVYDAEESYRVELSDGQGAYQEVFTGQLIQ